jgi:hypothetical protein
MEERVIGRAEYLGLFGDGSLVGIAKMCLSAPPPKVRLDNGILYPPSLSLPFLFSPPSSLLTSTRLTVSSHPQTPFYPSALSLLSSHCTRCSYTSTLPRLPSRRAFHVTSILYRSFLSRYILLESPLSSSYRVSGRVRLFDSSSRSGSDFLALYVA